MNKILLLIILIFFIVNNDFIHSQLPTDYTFTILSNFSLPTKDSNGVIFNNVITTYLLSFSGPIGGVKLEQIIKKNGQDIVMDILVPVPLYLASQDDIPYAVPISVLNIRQDIGSSNIVTEGVTPPASLNQGGLLLNSNNLNNPNITSNSSSSSNGFTTLSYSNTFSVMAMVNQRIQEMNDEGDNNAHGRNLKQAFIAKPCTTDGGDCLSTSVPYQEVLGILQKIDAANAGSSTPTNLVTQYPPDSASHSNLPSCKAANGKLYFSYGIPCVGSDLPNVLSDDSKVICLAAMWASWLEELNAHSSQPDCKTWSFSDLPKRGSSDMNNPSDTWCDGTTSRTNPLKWLKKAVAFLNKDDNEATRHRHVRVPLSFTNSTCKQLKTTYDGHSEKTVNILGSTDPSVAVAKNALCTISPSTTPTRIQQDPTPAGGTGGGLFGGSSSVVSQAPAYTPPVASIYDFNAPQVGKNDLLVYKYYDSPECSCFPSNMADTNFYYTCSTNPWVNDIPRIGNKPDGINYDVGIIQKCTPFIRDEPYKGGFCTPMLEDVNMFDYSTQVCEEYQPSYPSECMWRYYTCIAMLYLPCKIWHIDHCPTVTVCAGTFANSRTTAVEKTTNLIANQLTGTIQYAANVANLVDYASHETNNLMQAAAGFTNMSLEAGVAAQAIKFQESLQSQAQQQNNDSLTQQTKVLADIAAEQNYQIQYFNKQINDTANFIAGLSIVEQTYINQSQLATLLIQQAQTNQSAQLILQNHNADIVDQALQEIVEMFQKKVVDLELYQISKEDLDIQLANAKKLYGQIPLVSDYNPLTNSYGQKRLSGIPDQYVTMILDSYWDYSLEWLTGGTGPTNPSLSISTVRVHQQHWVEICDTASMLNYTKVSVTIDQFRDQINPSACSFQFTHTSCVSQATLGATINTILQSKGQSGQYALFNQMQPVTYNPNHFCVASSYQLHNSTILDYSYKVDSMVEKMARWPNLISLPNTQLWPGHVIVKGGIRGNMWQAAYIPQMIDVNTPSNLVPVGVDSFSRNLMEDSNPFATPYGIGAYVNTILGLFANSYQFGLGSSLILMIYQATSVGRLPRYGPHFVEYKFQQPVNQTAQQNSYVNPDASLRDVNNTATDLIISIFNDTSYINYLLGTLNTNQLEGFDNVIAYDFASVSPKSIPIIPMTFSDRLQSNITILLSTPVNSSTLTTDQLLNQNVFANASFATVSGVVDENKIFNSIATREFDAGYLTCLIGKQGCPLPRSPTAKLPINATSEADIAPELIQYAHFVFDIENIDVTPYARSMIESRGYGDIVRERLGGQLIAAYVNGTIENTLYIPIFRNASSKINTTWENAWGKSVLSYLNYTGQSYSTMIDTITDIYEILLEQAYNQGITITTANEDMLQWLVNYEPSDITVSMSSYLVTASCATIIPAAPFDDRQLWDCTCLKPISERKQMCRRLDLFYISAPVAWLLDTENGGDNPDNWDHYYLQPKKATIQFTVEMADSVVEQVYVARGPCPTAVTVQDDTVGAVPLLSMNRPNYNLNITLHIEMILGSTHYYNQSSFSDDSLQQDCSDFITSVATAPEFAQYDSIQKKWNISTAYHFVPTRDTTPIQFPLPVVPCQIFSIKISRADKNSTQQCYSWTTSGVPNAVIPNDIGLSIINNEITIRKLTSGLVFANRLNTIIQTTGQVLQDYLGTIQFDDVSTFASSQTVLDAFLSSALNNNITINVTQPQPQIQQPQQQTTSNSTLTLGQVLVLSSNTSVGSSTTNPNQTYVIKGVNLPTQESIYQTLNATGYNANFTAQYKQSWGDANEVQQIAFTLSQNVKNNIGNYGSGLSAEQLINFYDTVTSSYFLNNGKWSEIELNYLTTISKYNATAAVVRAVTQNPVFYTLTHAFGIACMNDIAVIQQTNPLLWNDISAKIILGYQLALIQQNNMIVVWYNPGSWVNGISNPDTKVFVSWLLSLTYILIIAYVIAWYGSTAKVQSRDGCFCLANYATVMFCKRSQAYRPIVKKKGVVHRKGGKYKSDYIPNIKEQLQEAHMKHKLKQQEQHSTNNNNTNSSISNYVVDTWQPNSDLESSPPPYSI